MLHVEWSSKALKDLERLNDFLSDVDPALAKRITNAIGLAPDRLIENPRIGERLSEIGNAEIRRLLIGNYEMRYEIFDNLIYVLRVFHCRESRS